MILIPNKNTESLSASEIREKLQKKEIGLCHKRNLSDSDNEDILEQMVRRIGPSIHRAPKKTLQVLKLGHNPDGHPVAQVNVSFEIQSNQDSIMATRFICDYCPHKAECIYSAWAEENPF